MIKFFDRIDDVLDGRTEPTPIEAVFMVLMIPTTLLTFIGGIWLAAAVAELCK